MGKNENTVTISIKLDTYDDFLVVKSILQQNKNFTRKLKESTGRNTVSWNDVAMYLIQLSKLAEKNDSEETAIRFMDLG